MQPPLTTIRLACSLYPNLRVARQHYVFTSHAGAPLAVWDRR